MTEPFPIEPGLRLEWRHTPEWTVCSRVVVDEVTRDGFVWIHFEETGTKNRVSIEAVRLNARPIPKRDPFDVLSDWLAAKFGRAAWRRFADEVVVEPRFSTWDLYLSAFVVAGLLGPRPWTLLAIVPVWLAVRLWARRAS